MLNDTHQLVHSLTKAEKRYFRRSASLHTVGEKNTYLTLFDILNRQKYLDENEILDAFRERHLYLLKRHLHKSILKSIYAFHTASSLPIQVQSTIGQVGVFYKKGLSKAALKLVYHAKKIALRHELHPELLQLIEWEIKVLASTQQLARVQKKISLAFKESIRQLELYRNFTDCLKFRMDVGAWHNKEIIISQTENDDGQKEFSKEIKRLNSLHLSGKARWELYNGAGTYFSTIGNDLQGNRYHKKAALISDNKDLLLGDELRQYILSLYLRSISYYYLKKYAESSRNLKIIRGVFSSVSDIKNKKNISDLYYNVLLLEGFILMDTGHYTKALPLIAELKKQVESPASAVNTTLKMDIYYQQTVFWFFIGDFRQAHSWISRLLQDEEAPKENPSRYRFARLMQLIILFEQGETEQVENLLPAAKKFLKRKGGTNKIEEALLVFFSQYARNKAIHSSDQRESFADLKKKLVQISKDKNEAASLRIFDYISWTTSKIEKKTMSEVIK